MAFASSAFSTFFFSFLLAFSSFLTDGQYQANDKVKRQRLYSLREYHALLTCSSCCFCLSTMPE